MKTELHAMNRDVTPQSASELPRSDPITAQSSSESAKHTEDSLAEPQRLQSQDQEEEPPTEASPPPAEKGSELFDISLPTSAPREGAAASAPTSSQSSDNPSGVSRNDVDGSPDQIGETSSSTPPSPHDVTTLSQRKAKTDIPESKVILKVR